MDDLTRSLPPALLAWLSDELDWLHSHSFEATIFLVLAWLVTSASTLKRQGYAIEKKIDALGYDLREITDRIERLERDRLYG